jgi:hypothetical protein
MRGLATRFRSVNAGPARMTDPARARSASPKPFRAPVGGLMLFDDLSAVPDGGALVLDNWFPLRNTARVRAGSTERNTGLGSSVSAIGAYRVGAADKAFAFTAGGSLFDVSAPGAVGSALVTGLTDTVWSFARFTTGAGTPYLVAAGYGNTRLVYNGTSWATTPAITGVTVSNLSQVWQHANRLFFVEKNTSNAWYLAVDNVGGAATKFPLGGEFPRGGSLFAGATWTTDAGDSGLKSTCVFLSDNGDIAVYDGADPSSWSKTGTYEIARPCGINCFMKTGGDLLIMTEDGIVAMSQIISLDGAALANQSVSKNILPMWRASVETSDTALWQITRRDKFGMALVSVPETSTDPAYQFVVNFQTGAWARWYGWAATCFATVGDELIFGTANGRILNGEEGGDDDGEPFTAIWIGPFAMKGGRVVTGKASRAVVRSAETFAPKLSLKFDYDINPPTAPSGGVSTSGALWDAAVWDTAVWGRVNETRQVWQSTPGRGQGAYAPCVQYTIAQAEDPQIELVRVDVVVEFGEVVA